jgi:hypothetical protein
MTAVMNFYSILIQATARVSFTFTSQFVPYRNKASKSNAYTEEECKNLLVEEEDDDPEST